MFNPNLLSSSGNKPEIDAPKRTSISRVVAFLDTHLPKFPYVFREKTSIARIDAEDDISQILWAYLERIARKTELFMVQFQYKYVKTRRSSDFGIIEAEDNNPNAIDKAFFVIEAKRLPTPGTDREGKSRKKEYVSSNYGGMERYKRGNHGRGLPDSAMVGYVQKRNCSHWHKEINTWIDELIKITSSDICWNSDDLLILENDFTTAQKYTSNNTRIVESEHDSIKLHHYLLDLTRR